MQECMRKYDRNLYLQFDQTFRQLPLATIIDGATLVVHAGIDDDLTVAKLDEVQRSLFTLMLAGPRGGGGRGSLEASGRDPWDMSEPSEDGAEAAAAPVDDPKTACSRLVSPVPRRLRPELTTRAALPTNTSHTALATTTGAMVGPSAATGVKNKAPTRRGQGCKAKAFSSHRVQEEGPHQKRPRM